MHYSQWMIGDVQVRVLFYFSGEEIIKHFDEKVPSK
jgi:hypothetical protein